jgi:transcriptional regulator with XRE-family HTH domain
MTGSDIRALRDRLGLSQQALADLLNGQGVGIAVTQVAVSRWERDEHAPAGPALTALRRLAGQTSAPRQPVTVAETIATYDGAMAAWEAERRERLRAGEPAHLADIILRVLGTTRAALIETTIDD